MSRRAYTAAGQRLADIGSPLARLPRTRLGLLMSDVLPVVRYMIVCEGLEQDARNPRRLTLVGLMSAIRSLEQPAYPLAYREICVFLQLSECRGPSTGWIEIIHADSGEPLVRTRPRTIPHVSDPLEIVGATFRLRDCCFPRAGLYWVQFWCNDQLAGQQPLLLR